MKSSKICEALERRASSSSAWSTIHQLTEYSDSQGVVEGDRPVTNTVKMCTPRSKRIRNNEIENINMKGKPS